MTSRKGKGGAATVFAHKDGAGMHAKDTVSLGLYRNRLGMSSSNMKRDHRFALMLSVNLKSTRAMELPSLSVAFLFRDWRPILGKRGARERIDFLTMSVIIVEALALTQIPRVHDAASLTS